MLVHASVQCTHVGSGTGVMQPSGPVSALQQVQMLINDMWFSERIFAEPYHFG